MGGSFRIPAASLNESPSEKEGKSPVIALPTRVLSPSMKVPPKRKGNPVVAGAGFGVRGGPQ